MKAISNHIALLRQAGMLVVCWAVPPLLGYFVGTVIGALGAVGAAAYWYSQYRLPIWKEGSGLSFWFVAGGYGLMGITLLVCLGLLLGVGR